MFHAKEGTYEYIPWFWYKRNQTPSPNLDQTLTSMGIELIPGLYQSCAQAIASKCYTGTKNTLNDLC